MLAFLASVRLSRPRACRCGHTRDSHTHMHSRTCCAFLAACGCTQYRRLWPWRSPDPGHDESRSDNLSDKRGGTVGDKCGAPTLSGKPCSRLGWAVDGRCFQHQGDGEPSKACAPQADTLRRLVQHTTANSVQGAAARRLLKILRTSQSPQDARQAISTIGDRDVRASALRLLDLIEVMHIARDIGNVPMIVRAAWLHFQAAHLAARETEREILEAEVFGTLKAATDQIAERASEQMRAVQERARSAESRMLVHETALLEREHRHAAAIAQEYADTVTADLSAGIDPHGFYVYLLWGDDPAKPAYVGQSANILSRLGTHMSDKFGITRRVTLIRCKSREAMDRKEARLIRDYQPPLNTQGVGRRADRVPATL